MDNHKDSFFPSKEEFSIEKRKARSSNPVRIKVF